MNFFNFIKKFLIFTAKEIYSFFLKLLLLFIFFIFLGISLVTFFSKQISLEESEKKNKKYEYVLFNPSNITEDKIITPSIISSFFETNKYNVSFTDLLNSLNNIKYDNNIKGIIINLDQVNLSSSKIEEISKKMNELKPHNKKIYAYGAYIDNSNYTLATIADEIITVPSASGGVSITGYHYSDLYYKNLLTKLGIDMEVVRIGDFKSYGENYTSNEISPALKNELTRILDIRYNTFLDNVAKTRKIDKDTLNNDILVGNNVNLTPFVARDKNFVDKLEYFNDFMQRINATTDNMTDIYNYYAIHQTEINNLVENKPNSDGTIAVIYAEGTIMYESSNDNTISINPSNMTEKLQETFKTKNLKGIILRVNSGGGSALASEMIYQTLSKLSSQTNIPIYVSMSETAASGGYYISMVGSKIFANEATITGSIGVVSMFPKLTNAQKKYGITSNSITKGKYADMYNSFEPLSNDARNKIIESMNATYTEFKSRVAANRNISTTELENYAQGKIWLGTEAKDIKLIDNIASLEQTIQIMANDLNLKRYNIKNIYSKRDFSGTLRFLSHYILNKISFKSQLQDISNNVLSEEIDLINSYEFLNQNKEKPLYYLPYKVFN